MSIHRLQKLREKKAKIDAKIQKLASQHRSQERKLETRRKIIAGALALHHAAKNPDDSFSKKLLRLLDEYVTKEWERNLFGLPVLPEDFSNLEVSNDEIIEQGNLKKEFHAGQ
jgi:hypothetical protein